MSQIKELCINAGLFSIKIAHFSLYRLFHFLFEILFSDMLK